MVTGFKGCALAGHTKLIKLSLIMKKWKRNTNSQKVCVCVCIYILIYLFKTAVFLDIVTCGWVGRCQHSGADWAACCLHNQVANSEDPIRLGTYYSPESHTYKNNLSAKMKE